MIVLGNGSVTEKIEELQLSVLLLNSNQPLHLNQLLLIDLVRGDDVRSHVLHDIGVRIIMLGIKIQAIHIIEVGVLEFLLPILDHDHILLSLEIIDADN